MAKVLGVSPGYVNLLENNERSLSLRVLMTLADNYGVDWRDIVSDKTSNLLAELRSVIKDPMFSPTLDVSELRAAIDHAPRLVEQFLQLYGVHRNTLERLMRQGTSGSTDRLLVTTGMRNAAIDLALLFFLLVHMLYGLRVVLVDVGWVPEDRFFWRTGVLALALFALAFYFLYVR